MATNGTLLNEETAKKCISSGIQRLSISIDGSTEDFHDKFRKVPGAFRSALEGMAIARKSGIPFQVNTTITQRNADQLADILKLAEEQGAVAWHIFLLVPTGRGRSLANETPDDVSYEVILNQIYDLMTQTKLEIKPTCAPQFLRILSHRGKISSRESALHSFTRGCLGGISFCFISHIGEVQPCGYLELNCGNVRESAFKDIWSNSTCFEQLRDYSQLKGKCGYCEFKKTCGGCRARAHTIHGDFLEAEPLCSYLPEKPKRIQRSK